MGRAARERGLRRLGLARVGDGLRHRLVARRRIGGRLLHAGGGPTGTLDLAEAQSLADELAGTDDSTSSYS